jgi:hypothetical protein
MDPQNYTLVVTDDLGCESEISVVLITTKGEVLSAYPQASPVEICHGASATINANASGGSGNYTYTWSSTEPGWSENGPVINVSPESTTTYYVEVNDGFSKYTTHVVLPVLPVPEIDLLPPGYVEIGDDTIVACVRDTLLLDAGDEANPPNMEYLWSNNWAGQYMIAKTNGNWFDVQTHAVQVRNSVTTCTNNDEITIVFDFNACEIGIGEETVNKEIPVSIHPNPAGELFFMQSDASVELLEIKLLDVQGSLIYEFAYEDIPGTGWKSSVDISELNKGIYLLWINADGQKDIIKLIKH